MTSKKKKVTKTKDSAAALARHTPIRLAILWHQHQPYYRAGKRFVLPWAWLHATKDYLEMAQHFERHPGMRGTINLVPSLLKQLEEYVNEEAIDPVIELMSKPANTLTAAEQDCMIENFFLANPHTVIFRSPRYHELHSRIFDRPEDRSERRTRLNEQDYRDLAVHYSLAWTGEIARTQPPFKPLVDKDRDYTEDDKLLLAAAQKKNVREIVALHKRLADRGQVELTTTPYYHPIMPLLTDVRSAREAMPDVSLPLAEFQWPEEADLQLQRGRAYFESQMESQPAGLWPSEGSLSEAVLGLARKNHFHWTATDEAVLGRSLGGKPVEWNGLTIKPEHAKFFPWQFETPHGSISIFFRDHRLSDNIGFSYQSWASQDAIGDFVHRILEIRTQLVAEYGEHVLETACVSVILDGENCWEYYTNNGFEFLDGLYASLETHDLIQPVRFSDALSYAEATTMPALDGLVAGSWINANFRIWIGHAEDNAAWDALVAAKDAIDRSRDRLRTMHGAAHTKLEQQIERAHEELLIAEGSDWCWWYGDDHFSVQKDTFDELFRMHLRSVYVHLDIPVPDVLLTPIPERKDIHSLYHRPSELVHREAGQSEAPQLAGKLLNESWFGIPNVAPAKVFGAMHRSLDFEIDDLQVALVGVEVLFRLIPSPALPETASLQMIFEQPVSVMCELSHAGCKIQAPYAPAAAIRGVVDETVEFAIPKSVFDGTKQLHFHIDIVREGNEVIRIPEDGTIECEITIVS